MRAELVELLKPGKDTARAEGSSIQGEKILAQARKFIYKSLTTGSSTHKIQRYDLEVNAFAIIAKPLRLLSSPKTSE